MTPLRHWGSMDSAAGRRVTIVELDGGGHRFAYVRHIALRAQEQGSSVSLVTRPRCLDSDEHATHLSGIEFDSAILIPDDVRRPFATLPHSMSGQLVVVPDADRHLIAIAALALRQPRAQFSLLLMRDPRGLATFWKRWVKRLLVAAVQLLPNVRMSTLVSAGSSPAAGSGCVEDPVVLTGGPEEASRFRKTHAMGDGTFWFGILGAVSGRKNPHLALQALSRVSKDHDVALLVAGKLDDDVRDLRGIDANTTSSLRFLVIDRMLSDLELDAAVWALDCILLAHSNEGPSGLFGKARAAGTRILAAGAQSLKRDCEGLPSASWVPLTLIDLERGMRQAVESSCGRHVSLEVGNSFADELLCR